MLKHLCKLLLLAALLVPWATQAQPDTLTVADGTTSNSYIPIYGYWTDVAQHNQVIYPASMTASIVGDSITGMAFYMSSTNTSAWGITVTLKLGITSATTLSGLDASTALTQVWSGTMNGQSSVIWIEFDEAYPFQGGNLLLDITTTGGTFSGATFSGVTESNAAWYSYSSSSYSQSFIPKTSFLHVEGDFDVCAMPTDLVADIDSTEIDLSWTSASGVQGYNVYLNDSLIGSTTDTFYTVYGLTSNTVYNLKVTGDCGSGESPALGGNFRTECGPFGLPKSYNFDSDPYGVFPPCWTLLHSYGTDPSVNDVFHHSGSQSMYMQASYDYNMFATQEMPAAGNNLKVDFWAILSASYDGWLKAGVISDLSDTSTFIPLMEIYPSDGQWHHYEFVTNDLSSSETYRIAFRYYGTYAYNSGAAAVDDITVTNSDGCAMPRRVQAVNVDSNSVTLSWVAGSTSSNYVVAYNTTNDFDGATHIVDITDTNYTLTDLNPNQVYYFWVYTLCSDEDTSLVYPMGRVRTECASAMQVPIFDDFSSYESGTIPSCWTVLQSYNPYGTAYPYAYNFTSSYSSTHYLAFQASYGNPNLIVMPKIDVPANEMDIYVTAYKDSYNSGTFEVGYLTNPDSAETFHTLKTITSSSATEVEFTTDTVTADSIWIAFRATTNSQYFYGYVTQINIIHLNSCARPDYLVVDSVSYDVALLRFNGTGVDEYEVRYATVNNPESEDAVSVTGSDTTVLLENLEAGTYYYAWVRAICNDDEMSDWRPCQPFATTCGEDACAVTFIMHDSYGDGWNGNTINVFVNGNPAGTATLTNGSIGTSDPFYLCSEDTLTMTWTTGSYIGETSFEVNHAGIVSETMYGSDASTQGVFYTVAGCPSCMMVTDLAMDEENTTSSSIGITWTPGSANDDEWLIYLDGVPVGNATTNSYTIGNLTANTGYTIGVATLCATGDTSVVATFNAGTSCAGEECSVELQMYTTYTWGYGLYGSSVGVYQNGNYKGDYTVPQEYMLMSGTEYVYVCPGDSLTLNWTVGSSYYNNYLGFRVITLTGDTLYDSQGTTLSDGIVGVTAPVTCPSCIAPKKVTVSNITTTSATIAWTDNSTASGWHVIVTDGYNTAFDGTTTTNNLTVNTLTPASLYTVMVQSMCGAGDSSIYTTATFVTECVDITLPWSFDAATYTGAVVDQLPVCWSRPSAYTSGSYVYPYLSSGYIYAYTYDAPAIAATPRIPAAGNNLYVKFHGYAYIYGSATASVGIMTDLSDPDSYIPLYYFPNTNDGMTVEGDFTTDNVSGLTANDTVYVAMAVTYEGSDAYMYIYDIYVQELPDCDRPDSIVVSNLTATSATLSWDGTGANSYTIWYGDTVITVTGTSVNLTGLLPGSDYEVKLQANCTTDSSILRKTSFATECTTLSLPYSESFEIYSSYKQPNCWTMYDEYPDYNGNMTPMIYGYNGSTGSKSLEFYGNSGFEPLAVSPALTGADINALHVSFYAYGYAGFEAGIMTDPTDTSTFIPLLTQSSQVGYSWSYYSFMTNSLSDTLGTVYYVAIRYLDVSGYLNNIYIDDINVVEMPECSQEFASVTKGSFTNEGATISWVPGLGVNEDASYTIYLLNEDNTPITSYADVTSPYTFTGLNAGTTYNFYIELTCGGSVTAVSDTSSFMTWCSDQYFAYNYDSTMTESSFYYGPIGYSYYNYAYTQTLVDSAYIAALGNNEIVGMGFLPLSASTGSYYTQMTVYMANVPETSFSDWILPDDSTHVFQKVFDNANFNFSSTDWQIHHLENTFTWDGHSSVLVSVVRNHGSYGYPYSDFASHENDVVKTIYSFNDSYQYDYTDPSSSYSYNTTTSTSTGDIVFVACGATCAEPTGLNATDITYESATLNWSGDNDSYELRYKASTDADWSNTISLTETSYALTNINESTNYIFQVRGVCSGDETTYSEWVEGTFTTLVLPCFAPSALEAQTVTYSTATLNWEENGIATQWNVHVWNTQFDSIYSSTSHTFVVTGLAQNSDYNVAVSAQCAATTESDFSDTIAIHTPICQQPTGLTVTDKTATSVTIVWGGSGIGFDVEYGDEHFSEGVNTQVVHVTGNTYTITGLEPEYDYSVSVRAECEEGVYSAYCAQVDFTTPAQGEGIENAGTANVTLYPNPTSNATTIAISGVNGEVEITLVDLSGRVVMTDSMSCTGDCAKKLEVSGLSQGAYFVRLSGENVNMVKKLIVK